MNIENTRQANNLTNEISDIVKEIKSTGFTAEAAIKADYALNSFRRNLAAFAVQVGETNPLVKKLDGVANQAKDAITMRNPSTYM
ncbi:MAG: hypothetical protein ACXWCF_06650 [Kaistella sp.]